MNALLLPSTDLPDAELLDRCLGGERKAFGQLVAHHQGLVCAQAYSVCGDLGRSEDVAQEAFISAWRQLTTLRNRSKFKAWLCGIARHLALRVAEKRQRESGPASVFAQNFSTETPHDTAVSREEEAMVWDALEHLPEAYRTTLVLFYREQQSIFEVARSLSISEDAVKQRLSRGRAMLKQQVARTVENALARSRPGAAFTLGVLGALGISLPATATAAGEEQAAGALRRDLTRTWCGLAMGAPGEGDSAGPPSTAPRGSKREP